MTVKGTVQGGKIVLPEGVSLAEGLEVDINLPAAENVDPETAKTETGRRLLKLAGTCEGLPEDLSLNLDHYLYGTPKR